MYKIYASLTAGEKWNLWITDNFYISEQKTSKKTDKKEITYRLNTTVCGVVAACGALDCFDNFLFILAFDYSFKAGINFSVIVSLFSCLPMVISLTFFILFGEKISKLQFLAMVVAMISVFLITFSNNELFLDINEKKEVLMHPIWAVLMMFSVLMCITIRLTLMRAYCSVKGKELDTMLLSFTWSFLMNSCLFVYSIFNFGYLAGNNASFEDDLKYSLFGGFVGGTGDALASYASTFGNGGVATMLSGTCTFFQSMIERVFFDVHHSTLDYVILVVSFLAVVISALRQ